MIRNLTTSLVHEGFVKTDYKKKNHDHEYTLKEK